MPGAYLVDAANQMYRIVSENGERTPEQVAEVAAIAGKALKRVQDDREFRRAVSQASQERRRNDEAFRDALNSYLEPGEQLNTFLDQERAVLDTAGLEPGLREELLTQGRETIRLGGVQQSHPGQILEQVDQLQARAEGLSNQLQDARQIAKELEQAMKRNNNLADRLEEAYAYSRVVNQELDAARRENQRLAGQLAEAQRTNQYLIDRLANTGPQEASRGRERIFWRLTFGVGGGAMYIANLAAAPLIGLIASQTSCMLGSAFVSSALVSQ